MVLTDRVNFSLIHALYSFLIYHVEKLVQVDVEYANGIKFSLSAEFLRVYSPAADGKIRSIGSEKVHIWLHLTALIEHKALSNLNVYFMMLSLF